MSDVLFGGTVHLDGDDDAKAATENFRAALAVFLADQVAAGQIRSFELAVDEFVDVRPLRMDYDEALADAWRAGRPPDHPEPLSEYEAFGPVFP